MKAFDLYATLGLDSRAFTSGMTSARGQFNAFASSLGGGLGKIDLSISGLLRNTTSAMKSLEQTVQRGVMVTGTAATALFGGLATTGVKYNSMMEDYQMDFTTLLQDADKASDKVEELRKLDLSSPLDMTALAGATKLMLSFSIAEDEVSEKLLQLGDIAMGNTEKLNSLALAYSQIRSVGKLTMIDMRQMANQGFNPLKVIAEQTGVAIGDLQDYMSYGKPSKDMAASIKVAKEEVRQLGENASTGAQMLAQMAEDGYISADIVSEAITIVTSKGGQFYKASENAAKTLTGQLSILQGGVKKLVGSGFEPLSETLTDSILPNLNAFVDELDTAFNRRGGGADGLTGMLAVVRDELVEMRDDTDEWTERAKQGVIRTSVLFNNTGKLVNGMLPSMLEAGGEIWGQVQIGFENAIPNLRKSASLLATPLISGVTDANFRFLDVGLEILGGVAEGINKDFSDEGEGKIQKAFETGLGSMGDWFSDKQNTTNISNAAVSLLTSFGNAVIDNAPEILGGAAETVARVVTGGAGESTQTAAGNAAKNLFGATVGTVGLGLKVFGNLLGFTSEEELRKTVGTVKEYYDAIGDDISGAWRQLFAGPNIGTEAGPPLPPGFNDASSVLTAIANNSLTVDEAQESWEKLGGEVSDVAAEIEGVNEQLNNIDGRTVNVSWQMLLGPTPGTDYGNFKNIGLDSLAPSHSLRSHATGLDYVPYNEYIARLHEGEAVLTKEQAKRWRRGEDDTMMVVQTPQETRPVVLMIDGTEIGAVMYDNMNRRIENGNLQQIFGMGG